MNLGTFSIDDLIVHDIPRRPSDGSGQEVLLSDVVSSLDDELRNLFTRRMVQSLNKQRIGIVEDSPPSSLVPTQIRDVLDGRRQLVPVSQEIALHLHGCQNGVNPEGLLIVCTGQVDNVQCIGLMKLEREDAIRIQQTGSQGQKSFEINHLRDLMMGKNTKVFKASLFEKPNGKAGLLKGILSDPQRGSSASSDVSEFFLRDFLGCSLQEQPTVLTRRFFESSQSWLNSLDDDAKMARYELALISELNSNSSSIHPRQFAETNLDTADRTPYRNYVRDHGIQGEQIEKDLSLIESKVKRMTMTLSNSGIKVTGSPFAIDEYTEVVGDEDPHIRINDSLSEVRGGG